MKHAANLANSILRTLNENKGFVGDKVLIEYTRLGLRSYPQICLKRDLITLCKAVQKCVEQSERQQTSNVEQEQAVKL